jgi:PAS domain S-box-containing protein
MTSKPKHSIRGRLTRIIMITSTTSALLVCLGFAVSGLRNFEKRLIADLSTHAQVVSANSSAFLASGDRQGADEVLSALRAKPSVVAAAIYTERGEPFARYEPDLSIPIPRTVLKDGFVNRGDRYEMFYAIRNGQKRVGTLFVACDQRDRDSRLRQYWIIAAGTALFSLIIALVLSWSLQGSISGPIVALARVVRIVTEKKSFNVRVSNADLGDNDEIAELMTGFNSMLAEIEQRDDQLLLQQTLLEKMVAVRTDELTTANEELRFAKNAAEKIAEVNARLARESALILNSATEGILGVRVDNRPTFLNPAGARILGITLAEMGGRTIHEAIHHSHADGTPWSETDCANTQAMRRGESIGTMSDTFWRPDGTSVEVEYSSTPMLGEDGKQLGAVMMFRDLTERRAVERLKNEFASTVSHELRTPLTSIRGALGLLNSGMLGPISEKGQRMLEIAVSNTDRLVRLINDILDLERIDSGKVELTCDVVDAGTVLQHAIESVQSMADQLHVGLVTAPAMGAIWGDSDRIIQTLTNLLGNAIKFSPPHTTVTLSGVANETEFVFCVADEGRGVPDEKRESIFERFSQVDASDSRDKGGSGLGLAICRSIVHAHGGRIWAEANTGAGSRFQFTIPLAASTTTTTTTTASPAIETRVSPLQLTGGAHSVLVVEDDLDLARVMTAALQSRGFGVSHAINGGDAVDLCRQDEPDLIVLDLDLPDMDGFAVIGSLRQIAALGKTPVLVYSASDVALRDRPRLRLGPTAFLTKSRGGLADFEEHVVRLLGTVPGGHEPTARDLGRSLDFSGVARVVVVDLEPQEAMHGLDAALVARDHA